MAVEVRMPAYSESMEEADVVGWLVGPGDLVSEGDPIAEIETDKATGELEAPVSGVISQIVVAQGTQGVKVGELLAIIEPAAQDPVTDDPVEASAAGERALDATTASRASSASVGAAAATSQTLRQPASPASHREPQPPEPEPAGTAKSAQLPAPAVGPSRSQATALARRLADRAGLDIARIEGSGSSGRVVKADVESWAAAASGSAAATGHGPVTTQSAASGAVPPQLQLRVECRGDRARAACEQLSALEEPGGPIPLLALIVRAAAGALREVPEANVSWVANQLVTPEGVNVALGLAAAGRPPRQLRDADRKSLFALAAELADAQGEDQAQAGLTGTAALAVVHVGDAGIESIQLSASPPCVCVLGTGALTERPAAVDGKLELAEVISCTLAADARAVAPQSAARLLAAFKQRFEDPREMILY